MIEISFQCTVSLKPIAQKLTIKDVISENSLCREAKNELKKLKKQTEKI